MVLIVLRSLKFVNGFLCFLSTEMKNYSTKTRAVFFTTTQVKPSAGGFRPPQRKAFSLLSLSEISIQIRKGASGSIQYRIRLLQVVL